MLVSILDTPLWSNGNVVASSAGGPCSIPGRANFLVEVFRWCLLNCKTNARKFGPHSSPVIIWPSWTSENASLRFRTAMVSVWPHGRPTWPSLREQWVKFLTFTIFHLDCLFSAKFHWCLSDTFRIMIFLLEIETYFQNLSPRTRLVIQRTDERKSSRVRISSRQDPHLMMGVDSTPETLCEKHFRQWILSNKCMLQIKHHCHKPFDLQKFFSKKIR